MDKIKNQLAGVAALLGVIAAIGGGFVKYGEIVTKLDALEGASGGTDWSAQIAVLEEKVGALENADTSHTHMIHLTLMTTLQLRFLKKKYNYLKYR